MKKKQDQPLGFTMIEVLIVLTILAVFILAALWAYRIQLMKGRDAKRKSDLVKLQRVLEDYLNDHVCYPETLACGDNFSPYLSQIPCDPVNSGEMIYHYSVSDEGDCKKWYKIFAFLEYDKDPIIEKIGCAPDTCGSFNYVVSSPNVEVAEVQLNEIIPPFLAGPLPTSEPSASPTPGGTTITPTSGPTSTPEPTSPPGSTPTPTPTLSPCPGGWFSCLGQGGKCNFIGSYQDGAVCNNTCNFCAARSCSAYPACL